MSFLSLANELIIEIVEYLDNQRHIYSLVCVNRRLYHLLKPYLLRHNIQLRGSSALIWAARNDRRATARKLLHIGADVNTVTGSVLDGTALHAAAEKGHLAMVKLLLKNGANVEAQGFRGRKPLFTALISRHEEIARILFSKLSSVNVSIADSDLGLTPLHVACECKLSKSARHFLEAGADVNARSMSGSTPLHLVFGRNSIAFSRNTLCEDTLQTVLVLLEFGADPDLANWQTAFWDPYTARQLGAAHPDPRVRGIFKRDGNFRDSKGSNIHIGRVWMASDLKGEGSESGIHLNQACFDCNHLETRSSSLSRQDSNIIHRKPRISDKKPFPALDSGSSLKVPKPPPDGAWSSNVGRLIARMSIPDQPQCPPTPKAPQADPFPQLSKQSSENALDAVARDLWADFRKPRHHTVVEGNKLEDGEPNLSPGSKVTKARGKRWRQLRL